LLRELRSPPVGPAALAVLMLLLSGGDLGGKKIVMGDHDLPPVWTSPSGQ
jgi:hypothetical protein